MEGHESPCASFARRIHRCEIATTEIHHLARQAAAPRDPLPDLLRVLTHHKESPPTAGHWPPARVQMISRVKAQYGSRGDANTIARYGAEHHRACGKTRPVDDDTLARQPHRLVTLDIGAELSPGIIGDPNARRSRRNS